MYLFIALPLSTVKAGWTFSITIKNWEQIDVEIELPNVSNILDAGALKTTFHWPILNRHVDTSNVIYYENLQTCK